MGMSFSITVIATCDKCGKEVNNSLTFVAGRTLTIMQNGLLVIEKSGKFGFARYVQEKKQRERFRCE